MALTKPNVSLTKKIEALQNTYNPFLSESVKDDLEIVCQSVIHEKIQARPGFQSSDKFVWDIAKKLDEKWKPLISAEWAKVWEEIMNFLQVAIGNDVEAVEAQKENAFDHWENLRLKNNFITYWSVRGSRDLIIDITKEVFPVQMKSISYHPNHSGNGHSGTIELPENATYFDVWSAIDKLTVASGDHHHVFIERVVNISKLSTNPEYVVSLGS